MYSVSFYGQCVSYKMLKMVKTKELTTLCQKHCYLLSVKTWYVHLYFQINLLV